MTSTEPNPTDVLAQERARAAESHSLRRKPDSYHVDMLRSESGRADLFRMLRDSGCWCPTPEQKELRREWAFARASAAALLDRLMDQYPLAVGAMWAEAMARWNAERTGKTQ